MATAFSPLAAGRCLEVVSAGAPADRRVDSGGGSRPRLRLAIVHCGSLLLAGLIYGFGAADGGSFVFGPGLVVYAPAQLVWLILDVVRCRRDRPEAIAVPSSTLAEDGRQPPT